MPNSNADITVLENGLHLARSAAQEIIDGANGTFTEVARYVRGRNAWSIKYEVIYQWYDNGRHYRFRFRRPVEGRRQEEPFEYEREPIFAAEVIEMSHWVPVDKAKTLAETGGGN